MPKVPVYSSPAVQQDAIPGVRFSSGANANTFGAQGARNIAQIGQAAATIGEGLLAKEQADAELERKSIARDSATQAKEEISQYLETNIYNRSGKDTLTAYDDARAGIKKIREKYTQDLTDDKTRFLFDATVDPHEITHLETTGAFQRKGSEDYHKATINAENQADLDSAVLNHNNPNAIAEAETTIRANTAFTYSMEDKAVQDKRVALAVNDLHSRIVEKKEQESPQAALAYMNANWDKFDEMSRQKMKDAISAKADLQTVNSEAMRIASLPPQLQAAEIDKIKNPEIQKKTRSEVKDVLSFKEATKTLAEKQWFEPQFDALVKNPTAYQVPMNAPADMQEKLIGLKKKFMADELAAKGAGTAQATNWVYYNKIMKLPENEMMKFDVTSPEARANLHSTEIKQIINLQRGGKTERVQAQSFNSFVNGFIKNAKAEADFEKSSYIRGLIETEVNKYPEDQRKKSETWNKVAKDLTVTMDVPWAFDQPLYEVKRKGLKTEGPAERPATVPDKATWVDKDVGGVTLRGWLEITASGRRKLHRPDGTMAWVD